MPRLPRLDFHGAIHVVQMHGKGSLSVFFEANALGDGTGELSRASRDQAAVAVGQFLKLLDACLLECATQLFGYCVEPNAATLIVRIHGTSLEGFMQRLSGRFSRHLHAAGTVPKRDRAFAGRYQSKVLAPEYLPHAMRRLHALPMRTGLTRRAIDYPFSSASAYLGERAAVQLQTGVLFQALKRKGLSGLRGYREFMDAPESPHVTSLLEHGSLRDRRIIGGSVFVAQTHDAAQHPRAAYTRKELLSKVAMLLKYDSRSALFREGPQAVLARALVAWFAVNSGSASVREVGSWFHVSGAALGKAIRHYRRSQPALFESVLAQIDEDHDSEE